VLMVAPQAADIQAVALHLGGEPSLTVYGRTSFLPFAHIWLVPGVNDRDALGKPETTLLKRRRTAPRLDHPLKVLIFLW